MKLVLVLQQNYKLIFHGKFGTAANETEEFKLPGIGIYADTGCYVALTNCDFCYTSRNIFKEFKWPIQHPILIRLIRIFLLMK